jgi:hypothetical protein
MHGGTTIKMFRVFNGISIAVVDLPHSFNPPQSDVHLKHKHGIKLHFLPHREQSVTISKTRNAH